MSSLNFQEQEQLEAVKGWWSENGTFILTTLIIFLVALGGWRGWQYYQAKTAQEAVTLFESFLKQMESEDPQRVNDAAKTLMAEYQNTAYASYTALFASQVNEQHDDLVRTKQQLQWVIDYASDASLKDVARLRLAAILLDEEKHEDALVLLNTKHPASFDGLYADLKGDVLTAQGKTQEAMSAYKIAFEKVDANSLYRNFIQMKMDDLGATQ